MVDAATQILAGDGWAGLTVTQVAARMGMSGQPVRSRVRSRADLADRIWTERASQPLMVAIGGCIDGVRALLKHGDGAELVQAWEAFGRREPAMDAAAELVIVAHYVQALNDPVLGDLRNLLGPILIPGRDRGRAARFAFAICLGLGMLMLARHERARTPGIASALATRAKALNAPSSPRRLPDATALHLLDFPALAPGDPALDLLLNATLELVADRGYDGVRVAEIARAAGFTEGLVYSRYRTKLELFQDAARRQNEAGFEVNHAFTEALRAKHGLGVAEAELLREYQLPAHRVPRVMALEQVRLTWHDPELMAQANATLDTYREGLLADPAWAFEGEADFFLNYAISLGAATLPILAPEAHRLPYDVVTVPLFELLGA